mmetsp:Transcript_37402/g.49169  ORF Transcript_37402/g.49169 Transcript_37402/m.49169 type:complete len:140 (-) Transcript_37402:1941-2360(-)|eukprot:CAMPEP_0185596766 /NCGR_PEP_ID=MMETSP0434-20130131/80947_1 /TAXON_ID=626734 ORGANISM="Favella taraikaensis, Strain Fe Narragansett Bay" /NCGR_SAMPLE_ID=MMETSP0434 /ASSEMBLY_ACC=CAM_ASM_000379 /LENGTH=139 /DNA_ID=CAMNT_0028225319 /DNA_START=82 /DNA_END=501 /DNA_ORIENTATION=-
MKCALGEFNKITKKHTFRSFINQDRTPERGTDIYTKVRRMQDSVPASNSSSLKFSLQEYAPSLDQERQDTIKLRKKVSVRKDIITGAEQADMKAKKFHIEPASKSGQTYYDMLITQQKPFHLRKGSLVTPDHVQRLELH